MIGPTSRYVHTNGLRMHYLEQGTGPLVLLCHGWPETSHSWRNQMQAIAEAGYRVIAPDFRGYGDTEVPAGIEDYSMDLLLGDVVGLVAALNEGQAILIGHDFGSVLSAHLALVRPDLFTAVALLAAPYMQRDALSPAARFESVTQDKNFYQAYFQVPGRVEAELDADVRRSVVGILYTASGDYLAAHPENSLSFAFFPKNDRLIDHLKVPQTLPAWLPEEDVAAYVRQFERTGYRPSVNWYRNMDRNWREQSFLAGARITQPTVFIAGELDPVVTMTKAHVDALDRSVPRLTKKVIIPGGGHWIQQEKPREVNEALLEFMRSL